MFTLEHAKQSHEVFTYVNDCKFVPPSSFILHFWSMFFFFFSSRRRHTRLQGDWSSDVCSSDLALRNKMFFFFSVIFPLGMFFVYSGIFAKSHPREVSFFLGPVIALNVMGSFWGLSAVLVMFREQGILRRFHVTPVSSVDMLASSILANYVLTLPTVALELAFAKVVFHVQNLGDPISLFVLVTVGTVSFASLGLVVASITNTMQETQVLNQLIWLPLIFLSGATLPMGYLPKSAQSISVFLPDRKSVV